MLEVNKVYQGDCLEVMKELPDNSVDSVVTDPPYELGFMGKKWDNSGISYNVEMWQEALRVLKPGGYLLSFGGSRTYHRMACVIEDAGFEIRDMIEWVYGSGFPKSHNIGKAVDKLRGNERKEIPNNRHGGGSSDIFPERNNFTTTKGTSEWEGWGTALKPAHEPICMARKPLSEKTIAKNVLKWGTGGLNIDGCRVGTNENLGRKEGTPCENVYELGINKKKKNRLIDNSTGKGRFPANFIHDGSDEVVGLFPDSKSSGGSGKASQKTAPNGIYGNYKEGHKSQNLGGLGDSGSASRFFYCAKASKSERNAGLEGFEERKQDLSRKEGNPGGDNPRNRGVNKRKNNHPTVKPIKLMEYLIKLVSKEGATVLDPFGGSGTTGIACKKNNRNFILIEKEKEYVEIAKKRIEKCEVQKKILPLEEKPKEDGFPPTPKCVGIQSTIL